MLGYPNTGSLVTSLLGFKSRRFHHPYMPSINPLFNTVTIIELQIASLHFRIVNLLDQLTTDNCQFSDFQKDLFKMSKCLQRKCEEGNLQEIPAGTSLDCGWMERWGAGGHSAETYFVYLSELYCIETWL